MSDVDLMIPEELRELANKKERTNKIVKKGILKHDLYENPLSCGRVLLDDDQEWLIKKQTKDEIINNFENQFELILPKGTSFVCFIIDGEESWYDDINYGAEDMSKEWAEEHLENIIET